MKNFYEFSTDFVNNLKSHPLYGESPKNNLLEIIGTIKSQHHSGSSFVVVMSMFLGIIEAWNEYQKEQD